MLPGGFVGAVRGDEVAEAEQALAGEPALVALVVVGVWRGGGRGVGVCGYGWG